MVAIYALYALSAITAVFAQAGIPACATTCAGAAATAAGCSTFTDAACICNSEKFFDSATPCVISTCSPADAVTAEALISALCNGVATTTFSVNTQSGAATSTTASGSSASSVLSSTSKLATSSVASVTSSIVESHSAVTSSILSSLSSATSALGTSLTGSLASSISSSAAAATSNAAVGRVFGAINAGPAAVVVAGLVFGAAAIVV